MRGDMVRLEDMRQDKRIRGNTRGYEGRYIIYKVQESILVHDLMNYSTFYIYVYGLYFFAFF